MRGSWMSQRKMLQFSPGVLLLLLPWFGGLVLGEISDDFSKCLDFFYDKTPPTGINPEGYQPICQRYKNQYHFASLYHRQHRTPLYSAYTLSPKEGDRPEGIWMYEPQLADSHASSEMKPFPETGPVDQNVIESQAVDDEYQKSIFTRGHLTPSMHQKTIESREATFTLTNIVPQREGSNTGPWSSLEEEVLKRFKTYCNGPMYVITGAMPYESGPRWIDKDKKRVSVPEYMWSAYCCPSYKSDLPGFNKNFFPTYAAVGRNDLDSKDEIVPVNAKVKGIGKGYDVRRMSLEDLEGILQIRLNMSTISLFKGRCSNNV